MAFDKTPEIDTHKMTRLPAIGKQTFVANTRDYASQQGRRYINCFPVTIRGENDPKTVLQKVPYKDSVTWTMPDTNAGFSCYDQDTALFCSGNKIYSITPNSGSTPTIALVATHTNANLIFQTITRMLDYSGNGNTIVAGLGMDTTTGNFYAYKFNKTTSTLTESATVLNALVGGLYVAAGYYLGDYVISSGESVIIRSIFMDGYHVIGIRGNGNGNNRIFNSDPGAVYQTFTSTNYIVPEMEADDLIDIQKHKNYIAAIGTKSIEFFYNAGNELGSPFSRQDNLKINIGAVGNAINGTIANGDDIYFIGSAPNSGISIWMIRDFRAIRISDEYIEYLLNSDSGIFKKQAPTVVRLGLVDVYGNVCVALQTTDTSTNTSNTFVFNEKEKLWWELVSSNSSGLAADTAILTSNVNGVPIFIEGSYLGKGTNEEYTILNVTAASSSTLTLYFLSKNPTAGATSAELYTDFEDFDNNNLKHWKWVDSVGDYGTNTIELAWTFKKNFDSFSTFVSRTQSTEPQAPVRWRNLGQGRGIAFRQRFRGSSGMAHEGLEISYNMRTQ